MSAEATQVVVEVSSTGASPVEDKPSQSGPISTPTVASHTDVVVEEAETAPNTAPTTEEPKAAEPVTAAVPSQPATSTTGSQPTTKKSPGTELRGSVAVSVVASSHASLNEALKRLRVEIDSIKTSGVPCEKALSTIDSLLIESESVLKDLISRSQGGETDASKKRRANAKRTGRRSGQKKEEGPVKAGATSDEDGPAGVISKDQQASSPQKQLGGAAAIRTKRVPLSGIFGNDRLAMRGPPAQHYQSPPARPVYRIDETVMQYRSPDYFRLVNENRYMAGGMTAPPPMAGGPRKVRPQYGRDRDVNKKRAVARAREEAAVRNELRNAKTIPEYTALLEKANKLGMQFEVAAVNARLAKLVKQDEAAVAPAAP
eukprot:Blabericola_migrator_1__12858@NODE_836_length_6320_cov_330_154166_g591_i0_p3_GENE_NODE_836_length_6320_cov_330_154166_g591_i0NODE_836_length_6320_cov_330_154166_g591_i0_p3_ORF_typecomplete_len373_score76_08_NODE_836_length_6320_cov_330_154166_g591_i051446262